MIVKKMLNMYTKCNYTINKYLYLRLSISESVKENLTTVKDVPGKFRRIITPR